MAVIDFMFDERVSLSLYLSLSLSLSECRKMEEGGTGKEEEEEEEEEEVHGTYIKCIIGAATITSLGEPESKFED